MNETQAYQNDERGRPSGVNHRLLTGKVVLLVGNDTAVTQLLIGQLAQKGADIALVCWHIPLETSAKIKERVQAFGRKLLLLEEMAGQTTSPAQLVQTITGELGQLDLFIDLSAQTSAPPGPNDDPNQMPAPVQPHWQFVTAVLPEIARSETTRS